MENFQALNKEHEEKEIILRNDYPRDSEWGMPIIKKSNVDISKIQLISADHVRISANPADVNKTIHFFLMDNKLDRFYNDPKNYIERFSQYQNVLSPDYSLYTNMALPIQICNTFKNRYCGACWQNYGLSVIPTVSWSTSESYRFCFGGIEYGSVVAISTVGCRNKATKRSFLDGYFFMKEKINPHQVLCYGKAYPEMGDEVILFRYRGFRKE